MDNPRRFEELVKFMVTYDLAEIPWYKPDRNIISFSNGVLQLAGGDFTLYSDLDAAEEGGLASRVARHHIPQPYTGCADTPLLDIILNAQFEPEVAELLLALIGRSLFQIGEREGWQVMPFLVGVGGTGKSLVLNIISELFARGAVGVLAAKREEVFGMANLLEKEVIIGRDMPAKMSASLPQEVMQCMTSGEEMEIPRKGTTALYKQWTAPLILAGNHMPDYLNTGNNVGRRIVSFRFDNVISRPQGDLQERILKGELPNVVCRALTAYNTYIKRVQVNGGGLWDNVPPQVLIWQGMLTAATNKVQEFLSMDDEERRCSITLVEGEVTLEQDFKAAFAAVFDPTFVRGNPKGYQQDAAVFQGGGFRLALKEKICRSCDKPSKAKPERCCKDYSQMNRSEKSRIYNMVLIRVGRELE